MKYRCLVLDHDDTAVNSTPLLHYPAHVEVMRRLRPGEVPISLEGWMLKNFSPGIMEYMEDELGLNPEEIDQEYQIWQEYVRDRRGEFFPGFLELLHDYHENGGIITVVSHSTAEHVLRDYREAGAEDLVQAVYGWDFNAEKRKPHPYPVQQIMRRFALLPEDVLVIDDLKPAIVMAREAGVAVGAAGWGIQVPEIAAYMQEHSDYFFATIQDLKDFLS